jgi:signal peptidase I
MEPTLNINDRVLVVKSYYVEPEIQSGDVVVFYSPNSEYEKNFLNDFVQGLNSIINFYDQTPPINSAIIKRVVGVGGDRVQIKENGEVYVNSNKFIVLNINEGSNFVEKVYDIPIGEVFVLGDNRNNSQDSRFIGTINNDLILGKAFYVVYPFTNFKFLDD